MQYVIEMVTMSDKDSLALRRENNMTDDKGNLLRGIDIWSGEVHKEIKSTFAKYGKSEFE